MYDTDLTDAAMKDLAAEITETAPEMEENLRYYMRGILDGMKRPLGLMRDEEKGA